MSQFTKCEITKKSSKTEIRYICSKCRNCGTKLPVPYKWPSNVRELHFNTWEKAHQKSGCKK